MPHLNLRNAIVAVCVVAGAAIMLAAGPAGAATIQIESNYGSVKNGRPYDWMEACDMERDGHGVFVEYWTTSGSHGTVWDGNGSKPNCGNLKVYEPDDVTSFRVCEDYPDGPDCSAVVKP